MNQDTSDFVTQQETFETKDNQQQPQLSRWVKGIIWFNIILGIRFVISCFTQMIFEPALGFIELIIQIIGIVSLIGILIAKRWAFITWGCYILIVCIINSVISGSVLWMLFALISIGLMYLMLQIKRDGISALDVLFNKKAVEEWKKKQTKPAEQTDSYNKVLESAVDVKAIATDTERPSDTSIVYEPNFILPARKEEITALSNSEVEVLPISRISQETDSKGNDNKSNTHASSSSNYSRFIHEINIKLDKSVILFVSLLFAGIIVLIVVIKGCSNKIEERETADTTAIGKSEEDDYSSSPDSYETEEERWDVVNCIYANFKYGIAFNLPNDMAWHKISGTAQHTVVKFVQPDTQITLFVNINPIGNVNYDGYTEDIWDVYEETVKLLLSVVQKSVNVNSAEKVLNYNYRKAEICGKHAIKIIYNSELNDDRFEDRSSLTTVEYMFLYNYSTVTVTVKCLDEVKEFLLDEGITLDDFLKSFQLTPISEKYIPKSTNKNAK